MQMTQSLYRCNIWLQSQGLGICLSEHQCNVLAACALTFARPRQSPPLQRQCIMSLNA